MNKITFDFKGRTALVTGGAQGFGLDIAKRFLKSGAKVIIWDIDSKTLEKVTKELDNLDLISDVVDVANSKEVENSIDNITKETNIDILINNAGITGPTNSLVTFSRVFESISQIITFAPDFKNLFAISSPKP
jgi:3-oxoacyl-[acyl-carrier protein] reductase